MSLAGLQKKERSRAARFMQFVTSGEHMQPVRCTSPPPPAANDAILQGGQLRVSFPDEYPAGPQPPQLEVMEGVAEALLNGRNAFVEAPTGTGKSLALLCTTLAYQSKMFADPSVPRDKVPRIVFVSRTHDQLNNLARELEKTKVRRA